MGSGFAKMKKQAKLMQEQYAKMQAEKESKEVVGTAGNGLVTVTLDGHGKMKALAIKPECVDPEDLEGLQDLILSAHYEAFKQLEEEGGEMGDLSSMMGGFSP